MDRAVLRIEARFPPARRLEPPRFRRHPGDRLARRVNSVHAKRRLAGMSRPPGHGYPHRQPPLVRGDRLHHRRLADHAQRRPQFGWQRPHEHAGAVAVHLLVVADEQVQRPFQLQRQKVRHRRQRGSHEALHVHRPARGGAAVRHLQRERIGAPVLPVHRHRVDVAGQREPALPLRPDQGMKVGLGPRGVEAQPAGNPEPGEILPYPVHQLEVAVAAGGVERDQALEDLNGGQALRSSHGQHPIRDRYRGNGRRTPPARRGRCRTLAADLARRQDRRTRCRTLLPVCTRCTVPGRPCRRGRVAFGWRAAARGWRRGRTPWRRNGAAGSSSAARSGAARAWARAPASWRGRSNDSPFPTPRSPPDPGRVTPASPVGPRPDQTARRWCCTSTLPSFPPP